MSIMRRRWEEGYIRMCVALGKGMPTDDEPNLTCMCLATLLVVWTKVGLARWNMTRSKTKVSALLMFLT